MDIRISYKHMKSSDSLADRATEKITHLIDKYLYHPTDVHVTFSVDHHDHVVDCHIAAGGGTRFHASARSDQMYGSIDQLIGKLEALLKKQKTRSTKRSHRSIKDQPYDAMLDGDYVEADQVRKIEKIRRINTARMMEAQL